MAYKVEYNIDIENAHILFPNFTGEKTQFNAAGSRNFCVELSEDQARQLEADGWNVKMRKPREEGDDPTYYMKVNIKYGGFKPPHVYVIANGQKTELDEDTIGMLQYADIRSVDLSIRPYNYDVSGKQGVSAYLQSMYVVIEVDKFASKYAD